MIIKVISPGSNTLDAIRLHLKDIQNGKRRTLETDFFETPVVGKKAVRQLMEDWDLDVDDLEWRHPYLAPARRTAPKLVHKLLVSMPAGTRPDKLLAAVRNFAQQQFADKHRYALALHTDEPHPHVHVVVRAMGLGCVRLNIRKPMLRAWRKAFARHLRGQGVAAKATQRAIRRPVRISQIKRMYRPVNGRQRVVPSSVSSGAAARGASCRSVCGTARA
ncbi:MAG: relaxase/mobilization nuclease domain-containing protein [Gammaproteobacteria bacterium]